MPTFSWLNNWNRVAQKTWMIINKFKRLPRKSITVLTSLNSDTIPTFCWLNNQKTWINQSFQKDLVRFNTFHSNRIPTFCWLSNQDWLSNSRAQGYINHSKRLLRKSTTVHAEFFQFRCNSDVLLNWSTRTKNEKRKKNENCTILIPEGNSYCRRKSSDRWPRSKVSSEGLAY